jgi:hypothetical protein
VELASNFSSGDGLEENVRILFECLRENVVLQIKMRQETNDGNGQMEGILVKIQSAA